MSAIIEKLAAPVVSSPGRARMTLKQLRQRWGASEPTFSSGGLRAGNTVVINGMTTEVWHSLDDGTKGEQQTYELEGD